MVRHLCGGRETCPLQASTGPVPTAGATILLAMCEFIKYIISVVLRHLCGMPPAGLKWLSATSKVIFSSCNGEEGTCRVDQLGPVLFFLQCVHIKGSVVVKHSWWTKSTCRGKYYSSNGFVLWSDISVAPAYLINFAQLHLQGQLFFLQCIQDIFVEAEGGMPTAN